MPASSVYLTPQQLSNVVFGAHEYYVNAKKSPHRQDKLNRPFIKWVSKKMVKRPFVGGVFNYNTQLESDAVLQEPYARDRLQFTEEFGGDTMVVDGVKTWLGLEILHDELRDNGFIIQHASNWKRAPKLSEASKIELVNILTEKFERREDRLDQLHDEWLHRDGTGTPALAGLAALFPADPAVGVIQGINRAANPDYRHQAITGTTVAAGTIRANLDNALRAANSRATQGRVDVAFCGSGFLNGIKQYVELNNLSINSQVAGFGKVDPAFPDSVLHWDGIPLVWDPTIDALAARGIGANTVAWFLNSSQIEVAYDMYKDFCRPSDEFDLMVSRFGWMSRLNMWTKQPNAHVRAAVV